MYNETGRYFDEEGVTVYHEQSYSILWIFLRDLFGYFDYGVPMGFENCTRTKEHC